MTDVTPSSLARVGLRLIAVWLAARGLWLLVANLIAALPAFDPSYLGYFFRTQLAAPLVGVVLGAILWLVAPPLARRVAGPRS